MNAATKPTSGDPVAAALASCNEALRRKDYASAWETLCLAVKAAPDNVDVRCYRGRIALVSNRLDEARSDFEEALKLAPRNLGARSGLARVLLLKGDFAAAEQEAEKALQVSPSDTESQQVRKEAQAAKARVQAAPKIPLSSVPGESVALASISEVRKSGGGLELADVLRRNQRFKNLHAGQRCFIIGNGPSTKQQDLTLLKDEISIAVNDFSRNPGITTIRSDYWVLADPLYWEKAETYFLPVAQRAVDHDLCPNLFFPTTGYGCFSNLRLGQLINCNYYHFTNATAENEIDFSRGIPTYGQNVIMVAIMLAFHLGCNPIYLIGVDHDIMNVTREQYDDYVSEHSYNNPATQSSKVAQEMSWDEWQGAKGRMLFQYNELKKYAERRGIDIRDATRGGHLDCFPKDDYESLFSGGAGLGRQWASLSAQKSSARLLSEAAVGLLNTGQTVAALGLLDQALFVNLQCRQPVLGIQYLRALGLARLDRFHEALVAAREDFSCNPLNRALAEPLIKDLEHECAKPPTDHRTLLSS